MIRRVDRQLDWSLIRRICCETGATGKQIDLGRWPFFSERWIGPYQGLMPDWAYVAVIDGRVSGYLTGCPDTVAFERGRRRLWVPLILAQIAMRRWGYSVDVRQFVRVELGMERSAEQCFGPEVSARIRSEFCAHLHVNLAAHVRGRGLGTGLVSEFIKDLKGLGTAAPKGIHIYCGAGPVGFYSQLGFTELGRSMARPGVEVYAMGYYI